MDKKILFFSMHQILVAKPFSSNRQIVCLTACACVYVSFFPYFFVDFFCDFSNLIDTRPLIKVEKHV